MPSTASRLTNLDGLKQEIRDAITISAVAEALDADLQASGDQWRSLCLLHTENTPSCYYSDAKGLYHCHGCKAGGDTIDLVQRVKHLDFIEALYWLAAEADVDVSAYERPMSEAEKAEEQFRTWCEGWLAITAAQPLFRRLDDVTAHQFGIVVRHGISAELSPYFNDKKYLGDGVILPWRTPSGRLVGWRVREHEGQEKKVIGTPNDWPLGPLYDTLFGIQIAREHIADGQVVVVEGEYDCLALHAVGIRNVVAMGGSSLKDSQIQLLEKLHVRDCTIVLDGDDAGYKAAHIVAEKYWAT